MKEKLIDGILENFDFDKVKKVMDFLDWTWATLPEPNSVPTHYQLINSARKKLEEVYDKSMEKKDDSYYYSGGLKAFAEYNKEIGKVDYLQLDFILTTWDEQI